jgi:hypothetical protein
MGIGTVGIIGIMLTVGSIFLGAPAAVAPAAHTILPIEWDMDAESEYLIQSDFGLYIIDSDGSVLREVGPPEGGFGQVHPVRGLPSLEPHLFVLSSKEALEVFSLDSGSITWAEAAHEPHAVDAADVDHDGNPEIAYADATGIHITGPQVPALSFAPPPLGDGEAVVDLQWYSGTISEPGLVALVKSDAGSRLHIVRAGFSSSFALDGAANSILWPGGEHLVVRGPDLVTFLNETSGHVRWSFGVPDGWSTGWAWTHDAGVAPPLGSHLHLLAYGPKGSGAVLFRGAGERAPTAEAFAIPGGFRVTTTVNELGAPGTNGTTFAGLGDNGSFLRVFVDLGSTPPSTAVGSSGEVLVVRESAQSVFGQLTSIPVAVTIGIFALMAGAFGPAALAGLTDVAQEDKRGTTMGLYSVVISSSMIVGPVATGYLVDNYGGFGVMVFLASSAAAMGVFMALRAFDVRRAGGERALRAKAKALKEGGDEEE